MNALRGFGMTFSCQTGSFRNWYLDAHGCKRWADNDEPVPGQAAMNEPLLSPLPPPPSSGAA